MTQLLKFSVALENTEYNTMWWRCRRGHRFIINDYINALAQNSTDTLWFCKYIQILIWDIAYSSHSDKAMRGNKTWNMLTHWGRVTHICISKLIIIGSDNGLSPGRRQIITWTNAGILLMGPLGTNFSEISIEIDISSFKKTHLKMLSAKCRPSCLVLNVLINL